MKDRDPKYLVRHFVQSTQDLAVYNTLFVSRLEMRKFLTSLTKKHGKNLNYKVLTLFDLHVTQNTETWSEKEILSAD